MERGRQAGSFEEIDLETARCKLTIEESQQYRCQEKNYLGQLILTRSDGQLEIQVPSSPRLLDGGPSHLLTSSTATYISTKKYTFFVHFFYFTTYLKHKV